MFQLILDRNGTVNSNWIKRLSDGASIPFYFNNTDYQQFKKDIQNGVVLNDASGNPITGSDLTTFLATLP